MITPRAAEALIEEVGAERFSASWSSPAHRLRRLVAEFIGLYGMMFILSGGAAMLASYGGGIPSPFARAVMLAVFEGLWLFSLTLVLGDISAHFNPAVTLAFALRGNMGWPMTAAYWVVQCVAAITGSLTARWFFGPLGRLAANRPPADHETQAVIFEALITFGLVIVILGITNGPKLNSPYVPFAIAAYVVVLGSLGGAFDGAAMNPARALAPDVALRQFGTTWVYIVGPLIGVAFAVPVARLLRGPPRAQEVRAAIGDPSLLEDEVSALEHEVSELADQEVRQPDRRAAP